MPQFEKVVVAVHGVGEQSRSETIRHVAAQFGKLATPPLPLMPLGHFSPDDETDIKVSALDASTCRDPATRAELEAIGFVEVYWADLPRSAVRAGDQMEEAKAWGRTVVSRVKALCRRSDDTGIEDVDFDQAADVIEEIVKAVDVLENLTVITDKMGIFKFDVAPLLRDYVNDVQAVAEFPLLREQIVGRFHKSMAAVVEQFTRAGHVPELYVVAHSEGSVVSFIALLQALAGMTVRDPEPAAGGPGNNLPMDWVRHVRGYMTIGAPIDKHIVLWESLWRRFPPADAAGGSPLACSMQADGSVAFAQHRLLLPARIDWRNYYDWGDPIGFSLDSARGFLARRQCDAFDFPADHDMGFARYPVPGKAHTGYWNDAEVFGHFIAHVVRDVPPAHRPAPPATRRWAQLASYALPYALVVALHLLAVFLLVKGINEYLPEPDQVTAAEMARRVGTLAFLLLAVTFAARLGRLVRMRFTLGQCLLFGAAVAGLVAAVALGASLFEWTGGGVLALAAALVVGPAWFVPRRIGLGRPYLVGMGTLVMAAIVIGVLALHADSEHGPIWSVVLAAAAFVYAWWLGIMLFDLAFVWHRYIRNEVARMAFDTWHKGRREA